MAKKRQVYVKTYYDVKRHQQYYRHKGRRCYLEQGQRAPYCDSYVRWGISGGKKLNPKRIKSKELRDKYHKKKGSTKIFKGHKYSPKGKSTGKKSRGSHGPRYKGKGPLKSYYVDVDRHGRVKRIVSIRRSMLADAKKSAKKKTRKTGYGATKDKRK